MQLVRARLIKTILVPNDRAMSYPNLVAKNMFNGRWQCVTCVPTINMCICIIHRNCGSDTCRVSAFPRADMLTRMLASNQNDALHCTSAHPYGHPAITIKTTPRHVLQVRVDQVFGGEYLLAEPNEK